MVYSSLLGEGGHRVRADHLSCYGYERETMPWLSDFAKDSLRYSNAYSTTSGTLPAHVSLLTGLYPIAHGVTESKLALNPETPADVP